MKKLKIILFLLTILVATDKANSQVELKTFGAGMRMQFYYFGDAFFAAGNYSMFPNQSFLFPVNITDKFRIEPEIGFSSSSHPSSGSHGKAVRSGVGLLYMIEKENLYILPGAMIVYSRADGHDVTANGQVNSEATLFGIGPQLEAEYFFANYFSLGADLMLQFSFQKTKNDNPVVEYKSNYVNTSTGFVVHFYF